jgi:hypothetical protein
MKKEKTAKTHLKLQRKLKLDRETLLALEPPDLAQVDAAVGTSACKSGVSCCRTTC